MPNPTELQWLSLWNRLGAKGDPHAIYLDLLTRYSEPHRKYHNFEHIEQCLVELEEVKHLTPNSDIIEFALWFHDCVYDTHANDSEEQSASVASLIARQTGLSENFVKTVEDLIVATKHTSTSSDFDTQLICDIDLTPLGQVAAVFDQNSLNIRFEYQWVPKEDYVPGRIKILETLLDRPTIYQTCYFWKKYENMARLNLSISIAWLPYYP